VLRIEHEDALQELSRNRKVEAVVRQEKGLPEQRLAPLALLLRCREERRAVSRLAAGACELVKLALPQPGWVGMLGPVRRRRHPPAAGPARAAAQTQRADSPRRECLATDACAFLARRGRGNPVCVGRQQQQQHRGQAGQAGPQRHPRRGAFRRSTLAAREQTIHWSDSSGADYESSAALQAVV